MKKSYAERLQLEENANGASTYVFEKNRQYNKVVAGTRASNVALLYPHVMDTLRGRYTSRAITRAVAAWEARWGPLPWALTQIVVTHISAQVLVEVRVEPVELA